MDYIINLSGLFYENLKQCFERIMIGCDLC